MARVHLLLVAFVLVSARELDNIKNSKQIRDELVAACSDTEATCIHETAKIADFLSSVHDLLSNFEKDFKKIDETTQQMSEMIDKMLHVNDSIDADVWLKDELIALDDILRRANHYLGGMPENERLLWQSLLDESKYLRQEL